MLTHQSLSLLDGLEYTNTRSEAENLFKNEMAQFGISDGWIAPNVPIDSIHPFLEDRTTHYIFGNRAGPMLSDMEAELAPMVLRGARDLQTEHMRHSVRPLMLSVDLPFEDLLLTQAAAISEDHGIFGILMLPCHHAGDTYGAYGFYALNDQPDLFQTMRGDVQALHLATVCFDSFCNLKFSPANDEAQISLAPREKECLLWVAAGYSSKRIAYKLGISLHTVNEFIGNAMRKLDATTRAEAAAKAISAKFINP